jgi:hypothetical protein
LSVGFLRISHNNNNDNTRHDMTMPQFTTDQEYAMKINSTSAHRSTQGFAVRRVRVTGPVENGRLPFVDLSDGNKEKAVYVTNILEVDGIPTGNRPARDEGSALREGDIVLVDAAATKDGTTQAKVEQIVDRDSVHLRPLIGGKILKNIQRRHLRKTTLRKLGNIAKNRSTRRRVKK